MFEEIQNKIRELGIPEDKVEEFFNLISEEVFENLFSQLVDISTDEELQVIENRMREPKSPEHFQTILNDIAVTVYGDNAIEELKNDYIVLLDGLKKSAQDAQDLIIRAQQGDIEAQKLLESVQQTEQYKRIMSDM